MFWEREEGDVDVLQSVVVVGGRPDSLGVAAVVRGFQECSLPFSCEAVTACNKGCGSTDWLSVQIQSSNRKEYGRCYA